MSNLFIPLPTDDLEPHIVSMGTCRALRIKRVGRVFFVENLNLNRSIGPDGKEVIDDDWKVVAISKGPKAYYEAHEWLADANIEVFKIIDQDRRRAEVPNGASVRRAG